jgi:hypothetical protein
MGIGSSPSLYLYAANTIIDGDQDLCGLKMNTAEKFKALRYQKLSFTNYCQPYSKLKHVPTDVLFALVRFFKTKYSTKIHKW